MALPAVPRDRTILALMQEDYRRDFMDQRHPFLNAVISAAAAMEKAGFQGQEDRGYLQREIGKRDHENVLQFYAPDGKTVLRVTFEDLGS